LAALTSDIDSIVQMAMKASEGDLLYRTKLRDHVAYLASDIDLSYARPTAAHYAASANSLLSGEEIVVRAMRGPIVALLLPTGIRGAAFRVSL
jgi:hypothetical protein